MTATGTIALVVLLLASLAALAGVVVVCSRRVLAAYGTVQTSVGRVQERLAALREVRAVTDAERAALDASLAELRAARDARRDRRRGAGRVDVVAERPGEQPPPGRLAAP